MATFEQTRSMRNQQHFEVLEIDLPVITGACTIGSSPGYGTPRTCDQAWSGEYKTYKFTNQNAPLIQGSPFRCIKSINETATAIKPGQGLAGRGSLSITFDDFTNQDPNPEAPAVNSTVKKQGTFFGKLAARQIFDNKKVRLKLYRVQPDGTIDLVNGAETRHYIAASFNSGSNGTWRLNCKDVMSLANLDEKEWPVTTNGFLRQDITDIQTVLQVDNETTYAIGMVVRIGDEFMRITGVDTSNPADKKIQILNRGDDIVGPVSGEILTITEKTEHSAGDEIFICEESDDETIDSLLTRILVDSDFDPALIPSTEWAAEVNEWHATTRINTLHIESKGVNEVLKSILNGFLMDMWFSTTENKAKLSAISVWKQSSATIKEGKEINAYTISKKPQEQIRASRALVLYDKRNLSDNDDDSSYKKGSQFSDNTIIGPELYGEHKDKRFKNNVMLDKDAADLLTQRYVSRFKFTSYIRDYKADERYLDFKTGDVVNVDSEVDQGFDGANSNNIRAQVLKINPEYNKEGRKYKVDLMTYEPVFEDNSEILLDGPLGEVNLYILAGAPSQPVTITFVLTAYSYGQTAIRAGQFPSGSKIILILANGFEGKANGGAGGDGEGIELDPETMSYTYFPPAQDGVNGGTVYDAQGVDTDIYFSGPTPSVAYPAADGYIFAPNGGDGGFDHVGTTSGDGGNGGNGRSPGAGGAAGFAGSPLPSGTAGTNGSINDTGAGWGQDGVDNDAQKGLAGSGIIDSGAANVVLFGATAARYVNGNGDH